jgi:hypothetical protein
MYLGVVITDLPYMLMFLVLFCSIIGVLKLRKAIQKKASDLAVEEFDYQKVRTQYEVIFKDEVWNTF